MRRHILVVLVMVMSLASPALAHSIEELDAWEEAWQSRFDAMVEENRGGLTLALALPLIEERIDWIDRHPGYYGHHEETAATTSAPTSVRRSSWGGGVEEWRPLVAAYFEPEDVETALCLMSYESGGNPNAKNPRSSASGLFQLLATWHVYFGIDPFVPEQNIQAAAQLQNLYGWSQWSPYNRGLCRGL